VLLILKNTVFEREDKTKQKICEEKDYLSGKLMILMMKLKEVNLKEKDR
jgi:hypothetical protein